VYLGCAFNNNSLIYQKKKRKDMHMFSCLIHKNSVGKSSSMTFFCLLFFSFSVLVNFVPF
jgi:hypothetical protein